MSSPHRLQQIFGFSFPKLDIRAYGIFIVILQKRLLLPQLFFCYEYWKILFGNLQWKVCFKILWHSFLHSCSWGPKVTISYHTRSSQVCSAVQVLSSSVWYSWASLHDWLKYQHLQHLEEWTVSHSQKSTKEDLNYSPHIAK